jgi:integrase
MYTILSVPVSTPVRTELPFLFLNDRLLVEQVAYIRHLARSQYSSTVLRRITAVIGLFWEYCHYRRFSTVNLQQLTQLFECFIETRLYGCPELGWEPVSAATVSSDCAYLTDFFEYFHFNYGTLQPNPSIEQSVFSRESEVMQTSLLFYLYGRTKAAEGVQIKRQFDIKVEHKGAMPTEHAELNNVLRLIRLAKLRDKLLWMLLAFGGMRGSEALNLFAKDVSVLPNGLPQVLLKHPAQAEDRFRDRTGKVVTKKRIQYLDEMYSLTPRNLLSKSNPMYAGWKGMYYDNAKDLTSQVYWLLPQFAQKWSEYHLQYMELRMKHMADNPYYFINLRGEVRGTALKLGNLRLLFAAQSRRAGFNEHNGLAQVHSLRHFYKWALKNLGGMEDVDIMRCMHHRCLMSTTNYGAPSFEEMQESLAKAYQNLNQLSTHASQI